MKRVSKIILVEVLLVIAVGAFLARSCTRRPQGEAWDLIRAMEKSYESSFDGFLESPGTFLESPERGIWPYKDRWLDKLAALGRKAIRPAVTHYRARQRFSSVDPMRTLARWEFAEDLISVLARIRDQEAIPDLLGFAKDPDWSICRRATQALCNICSEKHLDQIVELISSMPAEHALQKSDLVRLIAGFQGEKVRRLFTSYLSNQEPALRREALRAIGRWKDASFLGAVQRLLQEDPEDSVRVAAAVALCKLGNEAGMRYLLELLEPDTRSGRILMAANAVAAMKEQAAVPKLNVLLRHRIQWLRECARDTLIAIGTPEATRAVEEAVADGSVLPKSEHARMR